MGMQKPTCKANVQGKAHGHGQAQTQEPVSASGDGSRGGTGCVVVWGEQIDEAFAVWFRLFAKLGQEFSGETGGVVATELGCKFPANREKRLSFARFSSQPDSSQPVFQGLRLQK